MWRYHHPGGLSALVLLILTSLCHQLGIKLSSDSPLCPTTTSTFNLSTPLTQSIYPLRPTITAPFALFVPLKPVYLRCLFRFNWHIYSFCFTLTSLLDPSPPLYPVYVGCQSQFTQSINPLTHSNQSNCPGLTSLVGIDPSRVPGAFPLLSCPPLERHQLIKNLKKTQKTTDSCPRIY